MYAVRFTSDVAKSSLLSLLFGPINITWHLDFVSCPEFRRQHKDSENAVLSEGINQFRSTRHFHRKM